MYSLVPDGRGDKRQVAAYARGGRLPDRIDRALPVEWSASWSSEWSDFTTEAGRGDCLLVGWPRVHVRGRAGRVALLAERHPLLPSVLVTRRQARNLACVSHVPIDEVVWIDEIDERLAAALDRAVQARLLDRLADAVAKEADWPAPLREALVLACRAQRPVRSVNQLARLADRSRSALWSQWRRVGGPDLPIRLKDVLDMLRLLRAAGRKVPGRSWAQVAREIGVSERTLRAQVKRLTGWTLSELEAAGQAGLWERLRSELEDTALGDIAP